MALRSRRAARDAALQALYGAWLGGVSVEQAMEAATDEQPLSEESAEWALALATDALAEGGFFERQFEPLLAYGWSISRLAVIDRMILVLAAAELWRRPGVAPKITISEAVRMAKKFGGKESSSFVNGVLAKLLPMSPKAEWDPSLEEPLPPDDPEPEVVSAEAEESEEPPEQGSPWMLRTEAR